MSSPTGQTALTTADLARLAQTADDVVAQSKKISGDLHGNLMAELMPNFKGEAANASAMVSLRVRTDLDAILADMQLMSDQVKTTNAKHQQNQAEHSQNLARLNGLLNQTYHTK